MVTWKGELLSTSKQSKLDYHVIVEIYLFYIFSGYQSTLATPVGNNMFFNPEST